MPWQQKITDGLADVIRFFIRTAFMVNVIMLALASVYFFGKVLWYSLRYFDRTLFSQPW